MTTCKKSSSATPLGTVASKVVTVIMLLVEHDIYDMEWC